jgi:hypothetical protein
MEEAAKKPQPFLLSYHLNATETHMFRQKKKKKFQKTGYIQPHLSTTATFN